MCVCVGRVEGGEGEEVYNVERRMYKKRERNWFSLSPLPRLHHHDIMTTVKPPNRGHFEDRPFVPCREVVLILEVLF